MAFILPPIEDRIVARPGAYKSKTAQYIPDLSYNEFWEDFYTRIRKTGLLFPLRDQVANIDPCFGYFGLRFHPVTHTPHYFHVGIDALGTLGTPIYPIGAGVFEYSGFTETNGKYVVISHPEIKTHDGFVLWSLYMHLSQVEIKFSQYQKMLREVSFHSYPTIPVPATQLIGKMGDTGDLRGMPVHLHLQLEFRNRDTIVVVDPAEVFWFPHHDNVSASVLTEAEFKIFCKNYKEMLKPWAPIWRKHSQ